MYTHLVYTFFSMSCSTALLPPASHTGSSTSVCCCCCCGPGGAPFLLYTPRGTRAPPLLLQRGAAARLRRGRLFRDYNGASCYFPMEAPKNQLTGRFIPY